jgi:hypothetical protein
LPPRKPRSRFDGPPKSDMSGEDTSGPDPDVPGPHASIAAGSRANENEIKRICNLQHDHLGHGGV